VTEETVLPPISEVPGLAAIKDPYDLLTPEEHAQLHKDLEEIARCRRRAYDRARDISLP